MPLMLSFYLCIQASDGEECPDQHKSTVQDWMMLCHGHLSIVIARILKMWIGLLQLKKYDELNEIPSFITQKCQQYVHSSCDLKLIHKNCKESS